MVPNNSDNSSNNQLQQDLVLISGAKSVSNFKDTMDRHHIDRHKHFKAAPVEVVSD